MALKISIKFMNAIENLRRRKTAWEEEASNNLGDAPAYLRCVEHADEIKICIALVQAAFLEPGVKSTAFILRNGQPVAEFTDASLARMALVMFQSNEEANGNTVHQWTMEGE